MGLKKSTPYRAYLKMQDECYSPDVKDCIIAFRVTEFTRDKIQSYGKISTFLEDATTKLLLELEKKNAK